MSVTKNTLIHAINHKTYLSMKESTECVDSFFEVIKDALAKGTDVKVSGFGKFEVKSKTSRKGRNPQTGESIEISARRVLTFKPSQTLKEKINK